MADETDCGIILALPNMKEILEGRPCCSLRDETAQNRLVINCNATKITFFQYDAYHRTYDIGGDLNVFGRLTELETLYVPNNRFEGAMPAFKNWKKLRHLNLSNNSNLTASFPEFSDDMEEIELRGLNFYQPMPLVYPKKLKKLVLTGANIIGTIPTQLGSLTQLTNLELGHNYLTGGIPSEIGQLHGLWGVELQGNQLTGSIPSEFSAFKNLLKCQLHNNSLTGRIPSSYDVDRRANPRMTLIVHHNLLDGPLPLKLDPSDDFGFNCFDAQFPRNAVCSGKANQEGLRGEMIAAISVECALVILIAVLVGFIVHRRRRQIVVPVPAKSVDAPSTPVISNLPRIHQHRISKESLIELLEHQEMPLPSRFDTSSSTKMAQVPSLLNQMVIHHENTMDQRNLSMGSKKQDLSVLRDLEAMDPRTWSVQQTATWCKSIGSVAHTAVLGEQFPFSCSTASKKVSENIFLFW
ncbi:hypothetical protein CcCBS67573_g02208 [Chytriomyces confervae]|uniref:Uncharacterized protein n=1 Tax=Chytriomyces confervae TaxID=246404 RepID=A0A507FJX7_9FUNG|nr:hypothetical protein CcCBS67573_g02208 [Chytriomyces confervae]